MEPIVNKILNLFSERHQTEARLAGCHLADPAFGRIPAPWVLVRFEQLRHASIEMSELQTAIGQFEQFAISMGAQITWLWFYLQLAAIALAAGAGAVISLLVRRRLDLVSYTMGWPAALRLMARAFIESLTFVAFIVIIALIHAAIVSLTWPSRGYLLDVALKLATAWVAIRIIASQIRNKLAFQAIAVSAWLLAALSILGLLDQTIAVLDAMAIYFGGFRISALLVLKTISLLIVTLWTAAWIGNYFDRKIRGAKDLTPSLQVLIAKLAKLLLFTLTVIIVLNSVGIDLSALVLFSGAVGVGVGFGLQKIVSNFVSGIILLVDKSIRPGDVISVEDSFGWVETMGARYSSVVTRDGREFLIPNEELVTQRVINWSHSNDQIRIDVSFGVSYASDPHVVRRLAVEAAQSVPRVLTTPGPVCHLVKFADSSLDFILRVWIRDPIEGVTNVRGGVMLALWDTFKRHGIEIPYPVRDLRVAQPLHIVVDSASHG
jgi:small-conductance mechanosensitive channel